MSRLFIFLLLLGQTELTMGYYTDDPWPVGSKVVMQLGLGTTPTHLQDGMSSWNASAADAVDIWNGYLDFISFSSVSSATVPEASGDNVNSVFFSDTVFGDTFGGDTLAVTVILTAPGPMIIEMTEADVLVNTAFQFDSYRGPLQSSIDFHRTILHEFGHVLGLDHVGNDPAGQALMEPYISDLDHITSDDIAGVRSLYGAKITFLPVAVTLRVGDSYTSDTYRTNNNPTFFSATGLPPGLTIDSTTGKISGIVTTSGVYGLVITAHGPVADAYGTFPVTVLDLSEVPGLLAIFRGVDAPRVADPIRPRIYTAGQTGIGMVDTTTFQATTLISDDPYAGFNLSISADGSTLLYPHGDGASAQEFKVDLDSLSMLPPIDIPGISSAILEGLNSQAYVAGFNCVYQFDATSGALQQTFSTGSSYDDMPSIQISPDRTTLFVIQPYGAGRLASYDISSPVPMLLQEVSGYYSLPTPTSDGKYLYYVAPGADFQNTLVRAELPALTPTASGASAFWISSIAAGLNGLIYMSHSPSDFSTSEISIYDAASLLLKGEINPNDLSPDEFNYQVSSELLDNSEKYLFASVSGYYNELWVFSTDLAAYPPAPVHPTKDLLNISTRARVEPGENAMIGGFIVQGPSAKKVLVRGIGPSLPLDSTLSNPVLDLYDSFGQLLASNDNWTSDRLNILGTQVPPTSEREAAISMTLEPGAYTAVVHDLSNQPGLALVEVYDLDPENSLLANISTRGRVTTADNVMIGGFIVGGADPTKVLIRAIGPSLAAQNIALPLSDPLLELHDGTGTLVATNDNWRSNQQADIIATGIAPTDDRESALVATLQPGSYTAIVRGQNFTTGVALVEIYNLESSGAVKK